MAASPTEAIVKVLKVIFVLILFEKIIVWHAAANDCALSRYDRKGSGLRRRRSRLSHAAGRLIEKLRLVKRRYNYAWVVDRPDIGKHVEALQTRTGFMRAFCVLVAALAFVRCGFRSVLVTIARLCAVRGRDHRVLMRAFRGGQGSFRESGRNKTAA